MQHQPVLLAEVISNLAIKPDGLYVDATFGRGGHSRAILQQLSDKGRLLVIDKDSEAVAEAKSWDDKRIIVRHGSFSNMREFADELGWIGRVNGILLDVGVSSPQIDNAERGFSFTQNGPLDMRMDTSQKNTAADWINFATEEELARIFKLYGEERFSKRIANAIVKERQQEPILTTERLSKIVTKANPRWEKTKHPATRVFQAIRIFINDELCELQNVLEQCLDVLDVGGRLLVITFHSLEDRIVKEFLRKHSQRSDIPSKVPLKHEQLQLRVKKIGSALRASINELEINPRSRSANLRTCLKSR